MENKHITHHESGFLSIDNNLIRNIREIVFVSNVYYFDKMSRFTFCAFKICMFNGFSFEIEREDKETINEIRDELLDCIKYNYHE